MTIQEKVRAILVEANNNPFMTPRETITKIMHETGLTEPQALYIVNIITSYNGA